MTEQPLPQALSDLPDDFLWGVATASYQVEGAVSEDGRGLSVWDVFSHEPGRTVGGDTGDVACDSYRRWPEDVALLAGLGVDAYRFSIAWPRIQPSGAGAANPAGLDFYERFVDGLVEAGIAPVVTLFHWDLPQALEDVGGWMSRDTALRFAEYAALVGERLGDRVRLWATLNEPFVHTAMGHAFGVHAPGRTLMLDALPTAHHQLLGHGLAVQALRAQGRSGLGIVNNYSPAHAASAEPADRAAATAYDAFHNRSFTDPLLLGRYPELVGGPLEAAGVVRDGDLAVVAERLDFLGVNYYNPVRLTAPDEGSPLPFEIVPITEYPTTSFGWPVVPEGLRDTLVLLRDRYGPALPPMYVTENGCSYDDVVGADGTVEDPERIAFLDGHLRALAQAAAEGVDVRGYFCWSLLDNFEWAEGYSKRFGLVHVDFDTGARTPKSSYEWYGDVVRAIRAGRHHR